MFDVPAQDDPRIMVHIPVPVKGRKTPLVLKVPRFDFLDEDQHDAMMTASSEVDEQNKDLPLRKRQRLTDLSALKPFLSQRDFGVCETLPAGQLQAIIIAWAAGSSVPLGELLASAGSSTENTEAPSSSTSTPEAGQGETSDAA